MDLALLFADIRGSTVLAEQMDPSEYSDLIDRFYTASAEVLVENGAIIEKLAGDQVAALFVPGLVGKKYVEKAVNAANGLMTAYGYRDAEGPWVPVGAAVHAGNAFVGMVGTRGRMTELTSLGDPPNVTARLAGAAASGEVLVSAAAAATAGDRSDGSHEVRELTVKGKSARLTVHIIPPLTPLV